MSNSATRPFAISLTHMNLAKRFGVVIGPAFRWMVNVASPGAEGSGGFVSRFLVTAAVDVVRASDSACAVGSAELPL